MPLPLSNRSSRSRWQKVIILIGAGVISGCGSNTDGSTRASEETLAPTAPVQVTAPDSSPRSGGSQGPTPTGRVATGLQSAAYAEVVVDRLEAYTAPSGEVLIDTIEGGNSVFIVNGPVSEAGVEWYLIEFAYYRNGPTEFMFGWVPAAFGDTQTIRASQSRPYCDGAVNDIAAVSGLQDAERLICFRSRQIHLIGYVAPPNDDADFVFSTEPSWLDLRAGIRLRKFAHPEAEGGAVLLHIPPGLATPRVGEWIEVVAQYDHPMAGNCVRRSPGIDVDQAGASLDSLWCDQRLVAINWASTPPPH